MYQHAAQLKGASGCAAAQQCAVQSTQRLQRPVCAPGGLQGCSTAARPSPHLRNAGLPPQPENADERFQSAQGDRKTLLIVLAGSQDELRNWNFPCLSVKLPLSELNCVSEPHLQGKCTCFWGSSMLAELVSCCYMLLETGILLIYQAVWGWCTVQVRHCGPHNDQTCLA